jgi:hypothetical protein
VKSRSVRNHRWIWAGYLEIVEAEARCGLQLDANYGPGVIHRWRDHSPFGGFGSAMPMRFCHLDSGKLIDVFQQHYHADDNTLLGEQDYAYRFSDDHYEAIFTRVLIDAATRFHHPIGVNFHPGNWVLYSAAAGKKTGEIARRMGIPVWSYDQWLSFWLGRDGVKLTNVKWADSTLRFSARAAGEAHGVCIAVPEQVSTLKFAGAKAGAKACEISRVTRAGTQTVLLPLPLTTNEVNFEIRYSPATTAG